MKIVDKNISRKKVNQLAKKRFGNFIKAVVDIERKILVLDADLHADLEALLLAKGSKQKYLWGFNLYPQITGQDWIEFDSMINLRPSQNNLSRRINSKKIRDKIFNIVNMLITK